MWNPSGIDPSLVNKMLNSKCRKITVEMRAGDTSPHINSHYYYL